MYFFILGNTSTDAFQERLFSELKCLTKSNINIIQYDKGGQEHLAHRGESILAQSDTEL